MISTRSRNGTPMRTDRDADLPFLAPYWDGDTGRWLAPCPAHPDQRGRLSPGKDGTTGYFFCFTHRADCPASRTYRLPAGVQRVSGSRQAVPQNGDGPAEHDPGSWAVQDLGPVLAGRASHPPPTRLLRTDGRALLYAGQRHALYGEPESGKGWLALVACVDVIMLGGHVAYIDFEDSAVTAVERLRALGLPDDVIVSSFHYVRPDEQVSEPALDALVALGPELVVLDGQTEGMVMHGLNPDSNVDAATWGRMLASRFTRAGASTLEPDHVKKDKETRGRFAIGAQQKLAGVAVAYRLDVREPFGRGRNGLIKVTVTKDRHGHVRAQQSDGGRIAEMHLRSTANGKVSVELEPPSSGTADSFRPTVLMERIYDALTRSPGLSKTAVRKQVPGNTTYKDIALDLLVEEGYVDRRPEGNANRHYVAKPYVKDADPDHLTSPCPNPDQGRGAGDPDHLPAPLTGAGQGAGQAGGGRAPSDLTTVSGEDGAGA